MIICNMQASCCSQASHSAAEYSSFEISAKLTMSCMSTSWPTGLSTAGHCVGDDPEAYAGPPPQTSNCCNCQSSSTLLRCTHLRGGTLRRRSERVRRPLLATVQGGRRKLEATCVAARLQRLHTANLTTNGKPMPRQDSRQPLC